MPFKSYKEQSRTDWGKDTTIGLDREDLTFGAILRIADAIEAMAKNYVSLQDQLDCHKRWYLENKNQVKKLTHSNSALRGHVTRLQRLLMHHKREVASLIEASTGDKHLQ